ncbi:MAG: DUF4397 domain-containing protein [Chitinophagaceae bacterium]|nr:DUF4397 domain-containing protein [Chitinophagaceae bacterium]
MKKLIIFLIVLGVILPVIGCKKETLTTTPLASLKIANFVADGSSVQLGSYSLTVNNNRSADFTLLTGLQDIYVWPTGDSLNPYYKSDKAISVAENDTYTLFLGGTPTAPASVFLKEILPTHLDSTVGIRFINLAPGSPNVNVTLSTSPEVNEFSGLDYLDITPFKKFPAGMTNSNYIFQVRDANTGDILALFNMKGTSLATTVPAFRNVTLVLSGIVGGSPTTRISRVNHYNER